MFSLPTPLFSPLWVPGKKLLFLVAILLTGHLSSKPAKGLEPALVRSVLLLRAADGQCATGFRFGRNLVVTAAHFVESACPLRQCRRVLLFSASDIGTPAPREPSYSSIPFVGWDFSEFDIAALTFPAEAPLPPSFLQPGSHEPSPTEELYALGYPHCQQLHLSAGTVTTPYPLGWYSSIKGAPGMSGAPVFTGSGLLVGMIRGATTVGGMLRSGFLGGEFASQVMRTQEPLAWSALPDRDALTAGVNRATELQRHAMRSSSGHQRLWLSLEFQEMVGALARRAARASGTQGDVFRFITAPRPPSPPLPGPEPREQAINDLVLRSQLERWGLRTGWVTPLSEDDLSALSPEATSPYHSTIAEFREHPFPGSNLMQASLLVSYGALSALVGVLWALSIGYAIGRLYDRTLARRAWTALVIAFGAWPLSILIFIWKTRRRERQAAAPARSTSSHH